MNIKIRSVTLAVILFLSACSTKKVNTWNLLYNNCATCGGYLESLSGNRPQPKATSEQMRTYLDTMISNSSELNCTLNNIKKMIQNQSFLINYKEHNEYLKRYKKALKSFPISKNKISCKKNNKLFKNIKYEYNIMFNSEFNLFNNFEFKISEVADSVIIADSFNRIIFRNPYLGENKFIIYKISEIRSKPVYNIPFYSQCDQNFERFKGTCFAISKWPVLASPDNPANIESYMYAIIPINPIFFNYNTTLNNLPSFFTSFNPNNPKSYRLYLRMYLCGKYSNKIISPNSVSIDAVLSKYEDLTYIKSNGNYHFYAFYSEIKKKDMLVRLNTKKPEQIKVSTFKRYHNVNR